MKTLILLMVLLLPAAVSADIAPLNQRNVSNGGTTGTMCSAETTTGTPCATSDEIVLDLRGRWSVTFYGTQSTGAYTCDVYSNDIGNDASSDEGQDMTALSLTDTNQMVALEGLMGFVWIECSAITTSVTITYIAVPM